MPLGFQKVQTNMKTGIFLQLAPPVFSKKNPSGLQSTAIGLDPPLNHDEILRNSCRDWAVAGVNPSKALAINLRAKATSAWVFLATPIR